MIKKSAKLLIIILFFLFLSCDLDKDISDDEMIRNFQNNEDDFERLRKMAITDSEVMRIDSDFTWLKDNVSFPRPKSDKDLSEERWNEYRKLFKKLKLDNGIVNYESKKIIFFSVGAKDYMYATEEPSPILDSLDQPNFKRSEFEGKSSKTLYRKLKGNWYLYYGVD